MQTTRGFNYIIKRSKFNNKVEFCCCYWSLYISVSDIFRLRVISRRPARPTTIRLPIYLLCDNFWVWLYACVISRLRGEPAYKLSIPKRWDAVLFFFFVRSWGWSISHGGVVILFDTVHTSSPWEISSPSQENNCCHLRQISLRHLLPLTGFSCGAKIARRISALSHTS